MHMAAANPADSDDVKGLAVAAGMGIDRVPADIGEAAMVSVRAVPWSTIMWATAAMSALRGTASISQTPASHPNPAF